MKVINPTIYTHTFLYYTSE